MHADVRRGSHGGDMQAVLRKHPGECRPESVNFGETIIFNAR